MSGAHRRIRSAAGRRLAFGLCLRRGFFPFCQVLLIFGHGLGIDGHRLLVPRHDGHEVRILLQPVHVGPGLGGGAAPRGIDQADGLLELLVQFTAEEVPGGGEAGNGFGAALDPLTLAVLLRRLGDSPLNGEKPNLRVFRRCNLLFRVVHLIDGHLHVRLSGADPDLSGQDVLDCDGVLAFERDLVGASGVRRHDEEVPFALVVGLNSPRKISPTDRDLDLFVRIRPSPQMRLVSRLHDHVVSDDRRQPDVGLGVRRRQNGNCPHSHRHETAGSGPVTMHLFSP